jgi:hypothetical protein
VRRGCLARAAETTKHRRAPRRCAPAPRPGGATTFSALFWSSVGAGAWAPNNRLQGMRGRACFRAREVLRAGPAPLTLVSLGAAGTGSGAAHSARRHAFVRELPGRRIRGVHHRRAPTRDALRRAHGRRGCPARAAEEPSVGARHAGAHQLRGPAAPPPAARFSAPVLGLAVPLSAKFR